MIKVLRHGNKIETTNPVDGKKNIMINVVFVEEGRGGADKGMAETTAFLQSLVGGDVGNIGLSQMRTHTHPILADQIGNFPVGKTFDGHINRGLYSTPQIAQQADKDARMLDGQPTYFKTWISPTPEDDKDFRLDINILAQVKPSLLFNNVNTGAAQTRTLEYANTPEGVGGNQGASGNSSVNRDGGVNPEVTQPSDKKEFA